MNVSRTLGPVPGLFERQSINLLVGSSGSGKTRLLLSQLEDYAAGKGFLGYPHPENTQPVQLGIITCTRSLNDILHTVAQFPLLSSQQTFPIEFWNPGASDLEYDALKETYERLSSAIGRPAKFLIIEGLQALMLTNKPNDSKLAKDFCSNLHKLCAEKDVTILGTVGTAKMKRGDYYPLLSDRVFGAAVWAQEANTLIGIERTDLQMPVGIRPSIRRVIVQVQDAREKVLYADFDPEGRLSVVNVEQIDEKASTDAMMDTRLESEKPGTTFKRVQFIEWGEEIGIKETRVKEWISSRILLGFLQRQGNTKNVTYLKPHEQ
jgi:hypothetical protein